MSIYCDHLAPRRYIVLFSIYETNRIERCLEHMLILTISAFVGDPNPSSQPTSSPRS